MNGLESVLDMIVNLVLELLAVFARIIMELTNTELGKQIGLDGGSYPGQPATTTAITAEMLKAAGVGTMLKFAIPAVAIYVFFNGRIKMPKGGK